MLLQNEKKPQEETNKGSETEVTCDFVFRREASLWEPPQATIGLQRPAKKPNIGGHCCTAYLLFMKVT